MNTAFCSCCRHNVPAAITRDDIVLANGVARWRCTREDTNPGSTLGRAIHSELLEIEMWLQEATDNGDRDEIQCMATSLAVWRLHNRRDRAPYPVAQDDGETCIMITEQQLDEIIAEANKIIEEL